MATYMVLESNGLMEPRIQQALDWLAVLTAATGLVALTVYLWR